MKTQAHVKGLKSSDNVALCLWFCFIWKTHTHHWFMPPERILCTLIICHLVSTDDSNYLIQFTYMYGWLEMIKNAW